MFESTWKLLGKEPGSPSVEACHLFIKVCSQPIPSCSGLRSGAMTEGMKHQAVHDQFLPESLSARVLKTRWPRLAITEINVMRRKDRIHKATWD